MFNLQLLFIVCLISLLFFGLRWARRHDGLQSIHQDNALVGLDACNTLLQLIANIQQHRGLSSAYLAGDKSFEERLLSKRREIEPIIAQLQNTAAVENTHTYPCFTPNDITLWRHRWSTLATGQGNHSVENSIATHSNLISILLNWLDAIGEARIDIPLRGKILDGAVRNFTHRLPQLTECLGQARATGSGVAAAGSCSAMAKVRLMFLVSRAESLMEQASALDPRGMVAAQKVKLLAAMIRTQMLASQQVNVSADTYFNEATAAIDAVFQWLESCSQILEMQISQVSKGTLTVNTLAASK